MICSGCGSFYRKGPCSCSNNTPLKVQVIKEIPIDESEKEVNLWLGPMDNPCNKCKNPSLYFMILPPVSADEPSIVKYWCKNCSEKSSVYKQ